MKKNVLRMMPRYITVSACALFIAVVVIAFLTSGCGLLSRDEPQPDTAVPTPSSLPETDPASAETVEKETAKNKALNNRALNNDTTANATADTSPGNDTTETLPVTFSDLIEYDAAMLAESLTPLEGSGEGLTVKGWLKARMKSAKAGLPELVRIPVAHQSVGWGCNCPDNYIGTDTGSEGVAWLEIKAGPHANLPLRPGRDGYVRVADGYFTGKTSDYNEEDGGEVVASYKKYEFHVIRSRPYREGRDDQLTLLLDGVESQREMPRLEDDRPWLAIVASFPYGTLKASKKIEKTLQKLKDKGVEDGAYFDSRMAPKLFCCFHIVTAGRYATAKEAKAAVKTLKKSGFKNAYARQGW